MPMAMKGTPSPTKTVARRTPFHLDNPQGDTDRVPQYVELSKQCLDKAAAKDADAKAKRQIEEQMFSQRKQSMAEAAAKEAAYQKMIRKQELDKMKMRVDASKEADRSREKDIVVLAKKELEEVRQKQAVMEAREKVSNKTQKEFYKMEIERMGQFGSTAREVEEKKQRDRAAAAAVIQKEMAERRAAREKAEKTFQKRSKAELMAEAKRQTDAELKKSMERRKEAAAQRMANIKYAETHSDRLHWEPPPSPIHIPTLAKKIREKAESAPTGKSSI
eukprot:CAMPEP_0115855664 /NCGR_PEP_ID=MMETSP0287-20121206/14658_1 /TAXON_ID=412157 /ORGANISM="Chrysochromulina rotalis, Strain UIO044" /LENGTH=275 /DNA_ID=CAMNT_0003309823 /DNA_START=61 /DNA_END=888 /DNA_ORIENTATION=-